jgi:hypothetical protein
MGNTIFFDVSESIATITINRPDHAKKAATSMVALVFARRSATVAQPGEARRPALRTCSFRIRLL